jgi:hypothetical protein
MSYREKETATMSDAADRLAQALRDFINDRVEDHQTGDHEGKAGTPATTGKAGTPAAKITGTEVM